MVVSVAGPRRSWGFSAENNCPFVLIFQVVNFFATYHVDASEKTSFYRCASTLISNRLKVNNILFIYYLASDLFHKGLWITAEGGCGRVCNERDYGTK